MIPCVLFALLMLVRPLSVGKDVNLVVGRSTVPTDDNGREKRFLEKLAKKTVVQVLGTSARY